MGIGSTAAIFSIVNAVLIRPLPFPHPRELYAAIETMKLGDFAVAPDYLAMRENLRGSYGSSIQEMAAYDNAGVNWTGADGAERLVAARVTASFFSTLQARPLYGRTFLPAEDRPGANKVVLISYGFWRRRFGGDKAIFGQTIRLDRAPALVIGVMPRSFDFPKGADVWLPLDLDEARQRRAMLIVEMIARAAPHASAAEIQEEFERLVTVVRNEYPSQIRLTPLPKRLHRVAASARHALTGTTNGQCAAGAAAFLRSRRIDVAHCMLYRGESYAGARHHPAAGSGGARGVGFASAANREPVSDREPAGIAAGRRARPGIRRCCSEGAQSLESDRVA